MTLPLRERKRRETERQIRTAARHLFIEHGYDAVNVEQVAAEANVSRRTVFNYFPSKEAILLQPDLDLTDAWRQIRDERPQDEPLWTSLTVVILTCMEVGRDWLLVLKRVEDTAPEMAQALYAATSPGTDELQAWAEARVPASAQPSARMQVNVATAAVGTAYHEWSIDEPFEVFLSLGQTYLAALGHGLENQ